MVVVLLCGQVLRTGTEQEAEGNERHRAGGGKRGGPIEAAKK